MSAEATGPRRSAGRPQCCSPKAAQRIREYKDQGFSLRKIAKLLNAENLPTPMGKAKWGKTHADRVLSTLYMRDLNADEAIGVAIRTVAA